MKPILEIQNISKKYKITHQSGGYLSLREKLQNAVRFAKTNTEDFLALNDVSFEVQAGESVGIIGRNGAGKSTLLKILSKITPPSKGKIISRGRIASLLEVGTGFHPELTGRENIFFNGSLLGMKRKEIELKFDEIVDFSGVEKFLDTPLKHYSSGMQLRLAFAVAAFLEPEILVIDEVLAVGDAEFQKKCLGKMEDVTRSGRTILFVSHQLGVVSQLCKRAILLDKGQLHTSADVNSVINEYGKLTNESNEFDNLDISAAKSYQILKVKPVNSSFERTANFAHDESLAIEVTFLCQQEIRHTHLMVSVNSKNGHRIFSADTPLTAESFVVGRPATARLTIPKETLTPGSYTLFVAIHSPNTVGYDVKDQICPITIYDNGSTFAQFENKWFYGDVFVKTKWEIINKDASQ